MANEIEVPEGKTIVLKVGESDKYAYIDGYVYSQENGVMAIIVYIKSGELSCVSPKELYATELWADSY